jgi:hypothetical protein
MTLEDSVRRHRLAILQHAALLGNVTQTCREAGISRTLFYRWRRGTLLECSGGSLITAMCFFCRTAVWIYHQDAKCATLTLYPFLFQRSHALHSSYDRIEE